MAPSARYGASTRVSSNVTRFTVKCMLFPSSNRMAHTAAEAAANVAIISHGVKLLVNSSNHEDRPSNRSVESHPKTRTRTRCPDHLTVRFISQQRLRPPQRQRRPHLHRRPLQ